MPPQMPAARMTRPLRLMPRLQIFSDLQTPTGQSEPRANIEILAVHEEAFVETVDPGVRLGAKQHEQARDPGGVCRAQVSRASAGQDFKRRDYRPVLFRRGFAGLHDARRQQAAFRPGLRHQRREHVAVEPDVGVQHQKPRRRAAAESLVVVCAETLWPRVLDALHRKAQPGEVGHGVGFRDVDRQHDLVDRRMAPAVQLFEQRADQRELSVTDDRNGDGLGGCERRGWQRA